MKSKIENAAEQRRRRGGWTRRNVLKSQIQDARDVGIGRLESRGGRRLKSQIANPCEDGMGYGRQGGMGLQVEFAD